MNDLSYLDNITYKTAIPFVPPIRFGKVVKVYDGDTITVASRLHENSPVYRFQVRLAGIDCPEMKTQNETEKQCAKLAKQLIIDSCLNQIVELRDVELEKYGRILAKVYCGTVCLNNLLCEHHLAVAYDGGTKKCPEDWMIYYNQSQK